MLADSSQLKLSADKVDVWSINIHAELARLDLYRQQLNAEELQRAEKFSVDYKYHEFVITRGLLKYLLAQQLGGMASELKLITLEHGKFVLDEQHNRQNIRFNVSHSHGESLVALTVHTEIGVDIEKIREQIDWQALARRFFSNTEFASLENCDKEKSLQAFFTCWTRKEAFVKAVGDGIAFGLKEFDVNIQPEEKAKLLCIHKNAAAVNNWSLHNLDVANGYVAALAVNRQHIAVKLWGC